MPADRPGALFLLTAMAGIVMVLAGVFKLGRYTRFVSLSVMTGFLTGVAVNILFGQIDDLTGTSPEGQTSIERGISVLLHPGEWDLPTLAYGLAAFVIVALLGRTRFSSYAALVALIVPTIALAVIGTTGVATVNDVGDIPTGIPLPQLPSPGDFTSVGAVGRARRRGDRAGPGDRGGRIRAEPGRIAIESEPGLHRAGRRATSPPVSSRANPSGDRSARRR